MTPHLDVLGIGCVAVDDLLFVDQYPQADAKQRVLRTERHGGGLTATALVAAARLGARCAYGGVFGTDELGEFVAERFRAEGVSLEHAVRSPGARTVHSIIVVSSAQLSRNIFFDVNGVVCAHPELPAAEVVRSAKVLLVDHVALPHVLRAARVAATAGIPVVADLEDAGRPGFADLLALVDHLVISSDFVPTLSREREPEAVVRDLARTGRSVVVTYGLDGAWFFGPGMPAPRHQPAFTVRTVDTTGCGDVFHGAYAAALARECALPERVRFAAAAAALKATRPGGQAGIPTRAHVERFLHEASAGGKPRSGGAEENP